MGLGVVLHKPCQDRGFTLRSVCRGCTKQHMKQQVPSSCSSPIVIVVMMAMIIVMMIFMIMGMMIMIVIHCYDCNDANDNEFQYDVHCSLW